jgi:hypothetical protein
MNTAILVCTKTSSTIEKYECILVNNTCLSVVMVILNQEKAPAASYIMESPLDF